jgi:hypothetical protein
VKNLLGLWMPLVNWKYVLKDFVNVQDADTTNASYRDQVLLGADYMHLMVATRMILSERKINKLLGLPSLDVSRKRRTLSVA